MLYDHCLQRPDDFQLNKQHSLAKGLVFAGLGRHVATTHYHDSSLYGSHGTLTNMVPSDDWVWVPELGRWATDYDATNDYVLVGKPTHLNNIRPLSIAAWVYPNNPDGSEPIVCKRGSYFGLGWFFQVGGSYPSNPRLSFYVDSNGGTDISSHSANDTISPACWQHVVMTWTGGLSPATSVKFYRDGNLLANKGGDTGTSDSDDSGVNLSIGGHGYFSTGTTFLDGKISDVLIYNKILSPQEISQLADPSNVMLSGLILPPRRRLWAVSGGAPPAFAGRNKIIGSGVLS